MSTASISFQGGRYTAIRLLGQGGQKSVHLVHDEALDRDCALSLIRTEALDADSLLRVEREAQAMARLTHPNIVSVYDIGEENGRPYIVCEYVPGGDLRDELRTAAGPLPLERCLSIARDLCEALAFVHERGIVHRDIKPGNVWLTGDGSIKLGDFGLALAVDRTRLTIAGSVMGTAAYMAPEQAHGQDVDARTDLYSLGCVLYELITGRPPFTGDDPLAVISQHVHVPPAPPSHHNPRLPRRLEWLTLHLLGKTRDERPDSVRTVLIELERISTEASQSVRGLVVEAGPAVQPLHRLGRAPFVGRQREMGRLKSALEEARAGHGSLLMIVGEPGAGKTRLAQELGLYARMRGTKVLTGHCTEGEGSPPFLPFMEAVDTVVSELTTEKLRGLLGDDGPTLAKLVPRIASRLRDLPPAPQLSPEAERYLLFQAVASLLREAAKQSGLLLVLEDLHWADQPSLLLLQHLARQLHEARLLAIGTYRDIEVGRQHPLTDTVAELRRERQFERIALEGLREEDLSALIANFSEGDTPFALAGALHKETEGNPFFVEEVLKHLVEEGVVRWERGQLSLGDQTLPRLSLPEGVRETVLRRLSRLSEDCNRVLTYASALPGGFSWEVLKGADGYEEDRLLELLDEAAAAQIIRERKEDGGGNYQFTHALIRQTVYDGLSGARRQRLHLRIAETLESSTLSEPEELSYHFSRAATMAPADKTFRYLILAGDKARKMAAWEDATDDYSQALDLPVPIGDDERATLLKGLGEARSGKGDWEGAVASWKEAMEIFDGLGDKDAVGWIAFSLRRLYGARGQFSEASEVVEQGLKVLGEDDSEIRSRLLAQAGFIRSAFGEAEQAERLFDESMAIGQRLDNSGAIGFTSFIRGMHCLNYCRLADAVDWLEQGNQRSLAAGDLWNASQSSSFGRHVLFALGRISEAETSMDDEERLARKAGNFLAVCETKWISSAIACLRGDLRRAEELAAQLLGHIRLMKADSGIPGALINLAYIRFLSGDWRSFEDLLSEATSSFAHMPAAATDDPRPVQLLLLAATDQEEQARDLLPDMQRYLSFDDPWTISLGEARATLAAALAILNEKEAVARLYEPLRQWIKSSKYVLTGASSVPQLVDRILGMVASVTGRPDEAIAHFETAAQQAREMGAVTELAETSYWYARFLFEQGRPRDREEAKARLAEARGIWEASGMPRQLERARSLEAIVGRG